MARRLISPTRLVLTSEFNAKPYFAGTVSRKSTTPPVDFFEPQVATNSQEAIVVIGVNEFVF